MPAISASTAARTTSALIAETLLDEMQRDPRVFSLGEDAGRMGGVFGATRRLRDELGPERALDTPISETAFVGLSVGAAQAGLRPVVELMFVDFLGVCFDQILNQMAKNTYMSGGEVRVPVVLRTAAGCIGAAAQHSQVLSATFAHIPGLKVAFPSSPGDACRLLRAAIRDDNPVIFLEHKMLLKTRISELPWAGDADDRADPAPLGKVRRLRDGADVTIVAAGWMVQEAMRAADRIAENGVHAGVVDVRTLVPLDREGLIEAAGAAPALLVVDEDYRDFGMCAEIMATIAEHLGPAAPRMRRLAPDVPVPASRPLEEALIPSPAAIADQAMAVISGEVRAQSV
jgi:pyruvate dehydrogenase E1 component beta subunit